MYEEYTYLDYTSSPKRGKSPGYGNHNTTAWRSRKTIFSVITLGEKSAVVIPVVIALCVPLFAMMAYVSLNKSNGLCFGSVCASVCVRVQVFMELNVLEAYIHLRILSYIYILESGSPMRLSADGHAVSLTGVFPVTTPRSFRWGRTCTIPGRDGTSAIEREGKVNHCDIRSIFDCFCKYYQYLSLCIHAHI